MNLIFLRRVSITGNGDARVCDGRGVNSTLHRARFTHANFSGAWRKAQVAAISVSTTVILARMLCFALCLSLHLSHPHSALRPLLLLLLLLLLLHSFYPPNTTNPCAPKPGLLFGRLAEESPLTDSSGTEDPTPTPPKDCKAYHRRLMPALAPATDPLALENESQWRLGVMRAFCAGALLPLMPC